MGKSWQTNEYKSTKHALQIVAAVNTDTETERERAREKERQREREREVVNNTSMHDNNGRTLATIAAVRSNIAAGSCAFRLSVIRT